MSATSKGSQLCHNAHDRMIIKKPTARTKERRMTVLRPAAMAARMRLVTDVVEA